MSTVDILERYNWTIQELTAFCTVCESRSLTKAALALHMAQPALSLMVRRWRQVTGDPLFVRSRYGVTPTENALALRNRILPSLTELSLSLKETGEFHPETATRLLRLHMSDCGQMLFLPALTRQLRDTAPNLPLHIKQYPSEEIQDALSNGSIDLALGALPMIKGRVHSRVLRKIPFVTVMRKGHYLENHLDLASFAEATHLVIDAVSSGHSVIEHWLRTHGIKRRIGMSVSHYLAMGDILNNSDYLLTVPEAAVRALLNSHHYLVVNPPIDLPTFDVRMHWHERSHADAAIVWLRRQFMALFNKEAADQEQLVRATMDTMAGL